VADDVPCDRRVAKLYLPPGGRYFGCRECYRLTYRSAQEHDARVGALLKDPEALEAGLLARRCGAPAPAPRLPLTEERILAWADRHKGRTGAWPHLNAGPVADAPGETWRGLNRALWGGHRGLPGGSSLARLLAERRGRRPRSPAPPLTVAQIRGWAERHRRRTGRWPGALSGPVLDAPGETWGAINLALWNGHRGLPRRLSLARLFRERRRGRRREE
jgi:hypothetical protein